MLEEGLWNWFKKHAKKKFGHWINWTIQHTDEGWEHFARAWVVLSLDDKILGSRVLRHPHSKKQFTRSATIAIPEEINQVVIRAYDRIHEFGGKELIIEINKDK